MMHRDYIELKVVREDRKYQDLIEKKILKLFIDELYLPILGILDKKIGVIKNSRPTALERAIHENKVYYYKGKFHGKFNSYISKELQGLGAKWDNKDKSYKIELSELPFSTQSTVSISESIFNEKVKIIDKKLEEISPTQVSEKLSVSQILDKNLFKIEKEFSESIKNITVEPQLTDEQRKRVADEWETNMQLDIKKFTDEQTIELRQKVKENVYSGVRRENLIKIFQESYGVTYNKAKFWAHQETNLMLAKYKESKYVAAGIPEYKWACVHMPHQKSPDAIYKKGDVRYSHGILEGKIFSWNDPPITTAPDQPQRRNNPGQDYNCRCFAIPVIRAKK